MSDHDFKQRNAGVPDDRPTSVSGVSAASQREACLADGRAPGEVIITRKGRCVTIGFPDQPIVDDANILTVHRDQLLTLINDDECDLLVFDLTGVRIILSGMLGLLASARNRGCDVELLNPSSEVQEILRITNLDSLFLIRGAVSQ